MTAVYADEQIAVFDDVLPPEQFHDYWDHCQRGTYAHVHSQMRANGFRLDDGNPLTGELVAWPSVSIDGLLPRNLDLSKAPLKFYPTGKAVDAVLEAIKAHCTHVTHLIGKEGEDWAGIKASQSIYPQGTGVSWHQDSGPYCGAVVFYAHPEWNVLWGGELFIAPPSTKAMKPRRENIHKFENRHEDDEILRAGIGRFVMPKPNRLIFIGPGHRHMVTKVTSAAGNHPRVSLAGFFVTPKGVMQMAHDYLGIEGLH